MTPPRVILVGTGHLAYRIRAMIVADGAEVVEPAPDDPHAERPGAPTFEAKVRRLQATDMSGVTGAYLVDDRDEINLEFLLALLSINQQLPVVLSLFNENISAHLQAANPNVRVVNPARIAAPQFVSALDTRIAHTLMYAPVPPVDDPHVARADALIVRLTIAFSVMVLLATVYFHGAQKLSWIDAFYFVVVTVATVGYGDINLATADTVSKLAGIALILGSTFFIWTIFSLTVDRLLKQREQLSLGQRVYTYRNHVIVCGLGRLGYFIAEGLLQRGERVLIVERNADLTTISHFRTLGADVYIGDARLPRVLQEVGAHRAKALYAVVNNDFTNLDIGLNARTFDPKLRLVLRIFDDAMATSVREDLDIHLTYSMTAVADTAVYRAMPSVAAAASAAATA